MSLPKAPPMASEGAKMPPGTPDQAVTQVATNLSSTYNWVASPLPSNMSRVWS